MNGGLDFKLVGTVALDGFRRNVFESRLQSLVFEGSDGDFHRHSRDEATHFGLVDVAAEDEVAHIGNAGNGGTVVERVGKDDRVTNFHGHVEDEARDGRADEGARCRCIRARNAIANHLQLVVGGGKFLACLTIVLRHFVVLVGGNVAFVEQRFHAVVVDFRLIGIDVGESDTRLCRRELLHIRNHFNFCDDFACLHHIARLFVDVGDDARNLRFYVYFVAWFDFSRDDGRAHDVLHFGCKLLIDNGLRLRLLPKENECSDEHEGNNRRKNQFKILFHIVFNLLNIEY